MANFARRATLQRESGYQPYGGEVGGQVHGSVGLLRAFLILIGVSSHEHG